MNHDFSKPQLDNFAKYLTGIMICDKKERHRHKQRAFYRDAKQALGLEDSEVRKLGSKRHWLMVFFANTLLQLNPKAEFLVERVKSGFETVGSTVQVRGHRGCAFIHRPCDEACSEAQNGR